MDTGELREAVNARFPDQRVWCKGFNTKHLHHKHQYRIVRQPNAGGEVVAISISCSDKRAAWVNAYRLTNPNS